MEIWRNATRFSPPPTRGEERDVHLYVLRFEDCAGLAEEWWRCLSALELWRTAEFRFEHLRERFVLAHAFLRQVLGDHLSMEPREVHFITGVCGKPQIDGRNLGFSLAHRESLAVVAGGASAILGVDGPADAWTLRTLVPGSDCCTAVAFRREP